MSMPWTPEATPDAEREAPRIAVALRYADGEGAPVVVASGRGSLAERIVDAAREAGVAIDDNPLLASALEHVPVDEPIPEDLYLAVAEVIGWVLRAKTRNGIAGRGETSGIADSIEQSGAEP